MSENSGFEEELEAGERKHRKIVKYDMELFVAIIIFVIIVVTVNFILKADYKPVGKIKPELPPSIIECNKSILNVAETFRKNSTDLQARASVDASKMSFDTVISYYNKVITKGTDEAVTIRVLDSCYMVAFRFRDTLESQKGLNEAGITPPVINGMDNDIRQLKAKIDSLVAGVDSYNSSGFFLKLNWLTPFPGKIEYNHVALPEVQPIVASSADSVQKR
jgi:hypothetical protein